MTAIRECETNGKPSPMQDTFWGGQVATTGAVEYIPHSCSIGGTRWLDWDWDWDWDWQRQRKGEGGRWERETGKTGKTGKEREEREKKERRKREERERAGGKTEGSKRRAGG